METELQTLTVVTVTAFDWERLRITLNSMPKIKINIEHILVCPRTDYKTQSIWKKHIEGINYENKLILDDNSGIYKAMNYGASFSSGRFISFWNSGDKLISVKSLNKIIDHLSISNLDYIYHQGKFPWLSESLMSPENLQKFITHEEKSYICHQLLMVRGTIFNELKGFDVRLKVASDIKMITELAVNYRGNFLTSKLLEVEIPKFSSENHRRARLESYLVAIVLLPFRLKVKVLLNIFRTEFSFLINKIAKILKGLLISTSI